MLAYSSIEEMVEGDLVETELQIEFEATSYVAAKTYGPPELCYPAEGGDIEIVEIWELRGTITRYGEYKLAPVKLRDDLLNIKNSNPDRWQIWENACINEASEAKDDCSYDYRED
jgi:hypothetical protein